ncbi:hypothetical protein [Pseudobacillus badius]|uniref:hypothetical protein n=1 Tax=Bacillus badius TaxID=1455 RepID=UPI0024A2FB20|nr:hypothetical protein [Bacillus badius]GLY11419.1 hypothetical protein Bbad01_26350 [Bacillus badius]
MKKIWGLLLLSLVLAACSEEPAKETPKDKPVAEEKAKEEKQDKRNEELSQAMTDKYKELHPDDAYVENIVVWEDLGIIRVETNEIPKEKEEVTMNTVGTVWYQNFREEFTPEHIELWADGANVNTSYDPRFKQ